MTFLRIAPALLLLTLCGVAHAQPTPAAQTVTGRLWLDDDGGAHLTVSRSQTYLLVDDAATAWGHAARAAVDEQVTARIRVVEPGMFGGKAELIGLRRRVRGRVSLPMGGAPMIEVDRSNVFQIEGAEWRGYLLRRVNEELDAELEITKPGMFGGKAKLRAVFFTAEGDVSRWDGGVRIDVNRSNLFTIRGDAWAKLLADVPAGERVRADLRLVEPGMFGGVAEVESLDAIAPRRARLRDEGGAATGGTVRKGAALRVLGVEDGRLRVELKSGAQGLLEPREVRLSTPRDAVAAAAAAANGASGALGALGR